jgi:L-threonylcarbamoyladenylate synthase
MTEILSPDTEGLARASQLLRAGSLVAFPTETVYGLGGDATNGTACAEIFAAKGRPSFNPLIVHVPDLAAARRLAVFDAALLVLAEAFWPGPLTLVAPLRAGHGLSELVSAGLPTVAVRVPAHPLARDLLHATGRPLAAPSANPSGRISPTTAAHVRAGLDDRIAAILDGGPCAVGLESTIIGGAPLRLMRAGGLPSEAVEACLGHAVPADTTPGKVQAPGQLSSHYAPGMPVTLNVQAPRPGHTLIGFGPVAGDVTFSAGGDLREAAARLFGTLHMADALGKPIDVAPIPHEGLGRAINDRLNRAAAPRP